MTPPRAGQLWSWHSRDLVYLVKKKHKDVHGHVHWEWIDLGKGVSFVSPLSIGSNAPGWELLVDR